MLLSDDKMTHLSHVILKHLHDHFSTRVIGDDAQALREVKRVLQSELMQEEEIDKRIRSRLRSYSRPIPEGSQEWDVLYKKFYEEEIRKRLKS